MDLTRNQNGGRLADNTRVAGLLRRAATIWLGLFAFYAVTGTGHSSFSDGFLILLTSRSLVDHGTFAVAAPPEGSVLPHRKEGAEGRYFMSFGPGLALAHAPAILFGRAAAPFGPTVEGGPVDSLARDEFWAQMTNAWIGAAVVAILFLFGVRMGFSLVAAYGVAFSVALASPLWLYARIDASEALQSLGLLGGFYGLWRSRTTESHVPGLIGGLLLGIAVAAKLANTIVLPWYAIYALSVAKAGERIRRTAVTFAPVVGTFLLLGLFNFARFGNAFDSGYHLDQEGFTTNLSTGVATLLASPSHGLVTFWPPFLVALAGTLRFGRRHWREAALAGAVFVTVLVTYSSWWAYWGYCWGPRFLVPAIPLLALFLLPIADAGRLGRILLLTASILGASIQTVAVTTGYWAQVEPARSHMVLGDPGRLVHDPAIAPIRIAWWILRATVLEKTGGSGESLELLRYPPWRETVAFEDGADDELVQIRGLDLWAAPERWRLPRQVLPGPAPDPPIPTSPPLRALLLTLVALSVGVGLVRRRSAPPRWGKHRIPAVY